MNRVSPFRKGIVRVTTAPAVSPQPKPPMRRANFLPRPVAPGSGLLLARRHGWNLRSVGMALQAPLGCGSHTCFRGGRGQIGFLNGGHLERGRGWDAGAIRPRGRPPPFSRCRRSTNRRSGRMAGARPRRRAWTRKFGSVTSVEPRASSRIPLAEPAPWMPAKPAPVNPFGGLCRLGAKLRPRPRVL